MDERILKWLYDVKLSMEEIDSYFEDHPKDFFKYRDNLMLKRAVERNLEIIDEAINHIVRRDEDYLRRISNAKAIVGLRFC